MAQLGVDKATAEQYVSTYEGMKVVAASMTPAAASKIETLAGKQRLSSNFEINSLPDANGKNHVTAVKNDATIPVDKIELYIEKRVQFHCSIWFGRKCKDLCVWKILPDGSKRLATVKTGAYRPSLASA
ncbi:hypothetical protein WH279_22600 [Erwinia sp. MYb375]|uniref:hypothetical protein n=1 Tax=Erwinia sp. MYb375 TaxID=2745272 RepID=UPI0030A122BC